MYRKVLEYFSEARPSAPTRHTKRNNYKFINYTDDDSASVQNLNIRLMWDIMETRRERE